MENENNSIGKEKEEFSFALKGFMIWSTFFTLIFIIMMFAEKIGK